MGYYPIECKACHGTAIFWSVNMTTTCSTCLERYKLLTVLRQRAEMPVAKRCECGHSMDYDHGPCDINRFMASPKDGRCMWCDHSLECHQKKASA